MKQQGFYPGGQAPKSLFTSSQTDFSRHNRHSDASRSRFLGPIKQYFPDTTGTPRQAPGKPKSILTLSAQKKDQS
ncbi:MAG: hypothetical protein CEE38_04485 [Planctomycetes bacterium B3_Pla]|nr:MAG: hypothetical protein CEE38_04485 [Planctomycetes bacterium B3_Pla]